ncbi:MAG: protein translocase subunit SecF [Treponema sp.]|nr:protein translocase subunit SecF [Treponema sp.]
MKKIIRFSKFFIPTAVISCILVAFSISGYVLNKGFALGVDFQAGLIQEVQIAPTAFNLRWNGTTNAVIQFDRSGIYIIISGIGAESRTYTYLFSEYPEIGEIKNAIARDLPDLEVTIPSSDNINSNWLLFSSQGNPQLNSVTPFVVHYLDPSSAPIDISEIRTAMAGFSQSVAVQSIGQPGDRHFMIRVEDKEDDRVRSDEVVQILESYFGKGYIAVVRSDYVGSSQSQKLIEQVFYLIPLALLIILIYLIIRFRLQYAVGAVVAILYDILVIIAFIVWTRLEFNTTSIAAILTILGYTTNNTIIFFDRVRENLRIYPDHSFKDVIDISLTNILGRTIITTATTMLAVLFLFIFTTGSMKDFALILLVGMTSGVYTTLFIVSGFVSFWNDQKIKQEKKKLVSA